MTWSHGRDKCNNLVFISFSSRLLRSVSEVQDDFYDCCVRKPSTPRVLMVVSTLKAKQQTLFFLQWLLQRSTKKPILTIQTVKYFEQIGHFTFVQSAKIPHVPNERLYTQESNVIVKSADHILVGRALGGIGRIIFTPNKVQGTFYIIKEKGGNRIILESHSTLFNKQICISGMVACESLLAG